MKYKLIVALVTGRIINVIWEPPYDTKQLNPDELLSIFSKTVCVEGFKEAIGCKWIAPSQIKSIEFRGQ